ncbi:MAG: response regulator [Lachnospiraceae bacterium]|nr:response regulator [Lachnospiraceae bacterium]
MYRIILADDEGIMLESLRTIINSQYAAECEIQTAKSGRTVIELAETYHPDIIFIDIQMPGINGIEAMKEIRKFNSAVLFIVISAYDKFDYAKEAINLGVVDYLMKPVKKQTVLDVLMKAMHCVEQERKKRSDNLKIREKLETVVPIIENGFINYLIVQEDFENDNNHYKELLDIKEDYGFIMTLQIEEPDSEQRNQNVVGMNVRAQSFYGECRELIREFFSCVIGPVMANRIILFVPRSIGTVEYEDRIQIIERARSMVRKLGERLEVKFRVGIGAVKPFAELRESYMESLKAVNESMGSVGHIKDLPIGCDYDGDYPADLEKKMFSMVEKGKTADTMTCATQFFDWMVLSYPDYMPDIQIKVLEFVMECEKIAFLNGGMTYGFTYRHNYLAEVLNAKSLDELKQWYLDKIREVCRNVQNSKEEQSESLVEKAKNYIMQNFQKDISLDDVSKLVDISPYYFSKLFKEETGENFIEYLTAIRIKNARLLLKNTEKSIKEICVESGYSDPNYFSRIFKKYMEVTPSEYRDNDMMGA